VSDYYGKQLTTTADLQTNACCCSTASPPKHIKDCIKNIHDDVLAKYYGCGLCLPSYDLTGAHILDLGCGAGRDVYIASQLVGPTGKVVGIDMTVEQLQVAKSTQEYHAKKFGFANVEFYQGTLEALNEVTELELGSFDVIISNCVLNLCADKQAVLQHCLALLKEGGEMHFSDVYTNRRVPASLQQDPMLWGECLSGALYWNDFQNMARKVGFIDPRLVESSPLSINNPKVSQMIDKAGCKGLEFYSATYRLWNMPNHLEPHCEDYGQAVRYKGTLPLFPSGWSLDNHHYFETGKLELVCGNTWNMLCQCPFLQSHFDFIGNFDRHYGIFDGCGTSMPFAKDAN
jgi:2-polyprenyl-3-methyl-5-hydroxy-6-metoxy-1,4-benzoquinol methylase